MSEPSPNTFDSNDVIFVPLSRLETELGGWKETFLLPGNHVVQLKTSFGPGKVSRWEFKRRNASIEKALRRISKELQKSDSEMDASQKPSNPPGVAEVILGLVTSDKMREAVRGDYEEEFHANCIKIGRDRARRMYWAGVLHSALPLVWNKVREAGIFGLLTKFLSH
jgi:hypothetical protein